MYTAPTLIRSLMGAGDSWVTKHDRSSLRVLGTVGEPINPIAWQWYHQVSCSLSNSQPVNLSDAHVFRSMGCGFWCQVSVQPISPTSVCMACAIGPSPCPVNGSISYAFRLRQPVTGYRYSCAHLCLFEIFLTRDHSAAVEDSTSRGPLLIMPLTRFLVHRHAVTSARVSRQLLGRCVIPLS